MKKHQSPASPAPDWRIKAGLIRNPVKTLPPGTPLPRPCDDNFGEAAPAAISTGSPASGPTGGTAAELQQRMFAPIAHVAPPYIVPGLTLLAGKPKKGKSWWTVDLALAVASIDGLFLARPVAHGDVLLLALEDSERRLRSRFSKLIGPFTPWPARLHYRTEWPRGDEAVAAVRRWLDEHPDARLVVVDVLTKIRPLVSAKGTTAYQADYEAIQGLQRLAGEKGVAIIVVHHTRKSAAGEGGDVFDVVSGTLGLTGCADSIIVFASSGTGMTLHLTGRDVEPVEHAVEFDHAACKWRVLGDADEVRKSDQRKIILETLRDNRDPMGPTDLAAACEMSVENVRRLLFKMKNTGEVRIASRGRYVLGYVGSIGSIASQPVDNSSEPIEPPPGSIRH